VNDQLNKQY